MLFEAVPRGGESDSQIVQGAWDFQKINQRYTDYMNILDQFPSASLRDNVAAKNLQRWAAMERQSWLEAICLDPLLPDPLLPRGYLGRDAWRQRVQVLAAAREQLSTFRP